MKKIAFIIPYFGRLPNYFPFWLKSIESNDSINFFLFTNDRRTFNFPQNITVTYMSYDEFVKFVSSKFEFELALKSPYKLCDFKPAYGFIFSEYLRNFDFWGHCDIDLIFGNIRKFISDDILNNYDKIQTLGHFELYRNTKRVNEHFKSNIPGFISYKEIFSSPALWAFDESTSPINQALWRDIKQFCNTSLFYDINYRFTNFKKNNAFTNTICYRDECSLFEVDETACKELLYVHFQSRNVNCNYTLGKAIVLSPYGLHYSNQTREICQKKYGKKNVLFNRNLLAIKKPLFVRLCQLYFLVLKKYPNAIFWMPSFLSKKQNWSRFNAKK